MTQESSASPSIAHNFVSGMIDQPLVSIIYIYKLFFIDNVKVANASCLKCSQTMILVSASIGYFSLISRKIGYWLKWLDNWTAFWRFSDGDHYTKWTPKTRILNLCDLAKSIWKPHMLLRCFCIHRFLSCF